MSTGRSAAKRAAKNAENASEIDKVQRIQAEDRLKKEKERSQKLFIRQLRARKSGGGFFEEGQTSSMLG